MERRERASQAAPYSGGRTFRRNVPTSEESPDDEVEDAAGDEDHFADPLAGGGLLPLRALEGVFVPRGPQISMR